MYHLPRQVDFAASDGCEPSRLGHELRCTQMRQLGFNAWQATTALSKQYAAPSAYRKWGGESIMVAFQSEIIPFCDTAVCDLDHMTNCACPLRRVNHGPHISESWLDDVFVPLAQQRD